MTTTPTKPNGKPAPDPTSIRTVSTFEDLLAGGPTRRVIDGMEVHFRELSAREVFDFIDMPDETPEEKKAKENKPFALLASALVTADGTRLIPDGEPYEEKLFSLGLGRLTRLVSALLETLGLSVDTAALEQTAKAALAGEPGGATLTPADAETGKG